jgi:hypothetical protein
MVDLNTTLTFASIDLVMILWGIDKLLEHAKDKKTIRFKKKLGGGVFVAGFFLFINVILTSNGLNLNFH